LTLPEIGTLASVFGELRDDAIALVTAKTAVPLESVALSGQFNQALDAFGNLSVMVASYNATIRAFNGEVTRFKEKQGTVDVSKLKTDLLQLELVELRHTPDIVESLDDYRAAEKRKLNLEKKRDSKSRIGPV